MCAIFSVVRRSEFESNLKSMLLHRLITGLAG